MVLADIPGLIPGASEGQGLGLRFLRHVERTRVLLHLVTLSETAMSGEEDEEREPLKDFDVINAELANFSPELAERRQIVAVTKADIPEVVEKFPAIQRAFAERGIPAFLISSATHQGVSELMYEILKVVEEHNEAQAD